MTIDADGKSRVVDVRSGGDVVMDGLTITNGHVVSAHGGAIFVNTGAELELTNAALSNSFASYSGGGLGNEGTATLTNVTVSDNSASYVGGGIVNYGSEATMTLANVTVSGNSASLNGGAGGGGIANLYGNATLTNVTVSGNSAGSGTGGVYHYSSGATVLVNSIVLGNNGAQTEGNITVTDSIIAGDQMSVFANIDATTGGGLLTDNGGPVQTIALLNDPSNPAIDAGDDTKAPEFDARGAARSDAPGVANNGANISDLGAVEAGPVKAPNNAPTVDGGIAAQPFREDTAVTFAIPADAFADKDGDALTLSAELVVDGKPQPLPAWLTLEKRADGDYAITGQPPKDFNGDLTIRVTASDDEASVSTDSLLAIIAVDDDPATVGGDTTGAIGEDAADPATGTLTVSDPDGAAEEGFQAATITGTHGTLTLDAAGAWSYAPGEAAQALGADESVKDTFTVLTVDGTQATVAVTVTGTNDEPTVWGIVSMGTHEDKDAIGGALAVSDPDADESSFVAMNETTDFGTFTFGADGLWSYDIANDATAVQDLGDGDKQEETFEVETADGTKETVSVTISGVNDVITGTDGAEKLVGFADDNTITGGAGNDFISGGAGTDTARMSGTVENATVTLAAAGHHLNVGNAADGTDTVAGDVERVEFADGGHVAITAANQAIAGITVHDAQGSTIRSVSIDKNANRVDTAFAEGVTTGRTVMDDSDSFAWSNLDTAFDAQGNRASVEIVSDGGMGTTTTFAGGEVTSQTLVDGGDEKGWARIERTHEDGAMVGQVTRGDDGVETKTTFSEGAVSGMSASDKEDAFAWNTQGATYENGVRATHTVRYDEDSRLQETVRTYSDGKLDTVAHTYTDLGDQKPWSELTVTREDGRMAEMAFTFDSGDTRTATFAADGSRTVVEGDVSDRFTWTAQTRAFDAEGDLAARDVVSDNGDTYGWERTENGSVHTWTDVSGSEPDWDVKTATLSDGDWTITLA